MYLILGLTKESSFFILTFAIIVAVVPGSFWISIEGYESRPGKRGFLGVLLLLFSSLLLPSSNSMTDWIWVNLFIVLLGSGLMLHDTIPKRDR